MIVQVYAKFSLLYISTNKVAYSQPHPNKGTCSATNSYKNRWRCRWKNYERENLLRTIDNSVPSKKYLRLIRGLDQHQASLLFQLWSGHIGLNHHLFRIQK